MGQATAFTTDYFVAGLGSEVVKITPPTGKEGLRIISSDFSPLVIRNTADSADLLRVSQAGDLTVSTINGRAIGTGSGGIAVNAGSASTNIGLSANYLEGRDWNDVTNLIANIPPSTPELHYFFSAQSNALHNGYSGLDSFCTYDASAVPGRSYHVWASGTTDRGFKKGVLYSNKQYGTFAITDTQSPDICRVLGITCDTNWINNYSNWIWDTSIDTCNNWNTNSTYAATARPSPVTTSLSAGTLNSTQYGGQYCGSNYAYLCIEDSGTYTDPGAVCGNSVVESGEACDDGNTVNDATCPYNCKADGGFCGDGYRGTGESCDPNEPSLSGRNRCSGSCSWLGDLDGDTIAGETDCWNNDGNAYPLSPNRSTISRDMNCDNQIESTTECTNTQTAYTVSTFPSCPSMAELQAAGECDKTQPGSSISTDGGGTPTCLYWGSPSYFSRCYWCAQQTTFYW
tara:strand:- start:1368 stop:2738 length:1371 start_codon:yes stop_codon:yes gene_type:complete